MEFVLFLVWLNHETVAQLLLWSLYSVCLYGTPTHYFPPADFFLDCLEVFFLKLFRIFINCLEKYKLSSNCSNRPTHQSLLPHPAREGDEGWAVAGHGEGAGPVVRGLPQTQDRLHPLCKCCDYIIASKGLFLIPRYLPLVTIFCSRELSARLAVCSTTWVTTRLPTGSSGSREVQLATSTVRCTIILPSHLRTWLPLFLSFSASAVQWPCYFLQERRVSRVVLRPSAGHQMKLWLGGDDREADRPRLVRFMDTHVSKVGGSMVFDFKFLGNSDFCLQLPSLPSGDHVDPPLGGWARHKAGGGLPGRPVGQPVSKWLWWFPTQRVTAADKMRLSPAAAINALRSLRKLLLVSLATNIYVVRVRLYAGEEREVPVVQNGGAPLPWRLMPGVPPQLRDHQRGRRCKGGLSALLWMGKNQELDIRISNILCFPSFCVRLLKYFSTSISVRNY